MSQWLSDAWDGVRDRASKMSLSQWLVVAAVATAGGLVIYRRERRKAFNRMIASWVRRVQCYGATAVACAVVHCLCSVQRGAMAVVRSL